MEDLKNKLEDPVLFELALKDVLLHIVEIDLPDLMKILLSGDMILLYCSTKMSS